MIQNWLAALRKRISKRAFWVEVLVALVVGGGIFWGVNNLRTNGYIVTQELQHHDFLHLLQEPDFGTKLITHTNVVIIGADEWDIQRFGWPLQDDTVAQILGKIASFKPAAIALDLYRDMPVPKRGDLIHHLNEVLTNNANIITISQVDLEEPELTIKPPAVLQGDGVRVGENSFASDPDLKIRRGMLYFYSDAGIHPSLAIQMAARYIGKNWWELLVPAPGPVLKIPSLPFQSLGLTNGQQIAMAVVQKTSRGQAVEIDNTEVIKFFASDNPLQYSEGGEVIKSTNIIELLDGRDVGDSNGDISSVTVTTADGVLAVDTRVRGVALPPSDWYPEAIGGEYEFSILLDTDNDPSTGFKPDGIDGLGADLVARVICKVRETENVESGTVFRPAGENSATNEIVMPDFAFGSVRDDLSELKIGKALFTKFDGNRGPYSGTDSGGYTYSMDYRGASSYQFPRFTVRALMGDENAKEGESASASCCKSGECRCSVKLGDIEGKLVFFGAVASSLKDYYAMPHNDRERLLATHALATDQLLRSFYNGDEVTQYWTRRGESWWIAFWSFMGVLLGFVVRENPGLRLLILAPIMFFGLLAYASWQFYSNQLWLPVIPPALAMFGSAVVMVFYLFLTEGRQKKAISGMFSTMVSPEVLKYLQEESGSLKLAGERREATMFFSDVAGFTTISEKLDAEQLAAVLNEYLTPMSDIIINYGGYIDKYEGDAIMADYGVPIWGDVDPHSHAWKCCWAAIEQQEKLKPLSLELKEKYDVEIGARMGINTGFVSAGNMGSTQKMQYTVMGDAVNQAARFEPACKIFTILIMIGQSTYDMAKDKIEVRKLGLLVAKGKKQAVGVYELLAKKGDLDETMANLVAKFESTWDIYAKRDFVEAKRGFEDCLKIVPDDGPSLAYIEQCDHFTENPPPEDWTGEWIQLTK
jgi:CHASE2 domain-containing sensor protein/class 3 adenylate cyclase